MMNFFTTASTASKKKTPAKKVAGAGATKKKTTTPRKNDTKLRDAATTAIKTATDALKTAKPRKTAVVKPVKPVKSKTPPASTVKTITVKSAAPATIKSIKGKIAGKPVAGKGKPVKGKPVTGKGKTVKGKPTYRGGGDGQVNPMVGSTIGYGSGMPGASSSAPAGLSTSTLAMYSGTGSIMPYRDDTVLTPLASGMMSPGAPFSIADPNIPASDSYHHRY